MKTPCRLAKLLFNKPTSKDGFFTNDFSICNDKPPYKLYQRIGDPDEWTGALYKQKE